MADKELDQEVKSCQSCGASVYPEHLERGQAGYSGGQLLCSVCLGESKSQAQSDQGQTEMAEGDDDSLSLVDEEELEGSGRKVITAFGGDQAAKGVADESKLIRSLNKTGQGATRFRLFHTKLSDGATAFLTQHINEWLDAHPDVEVKSTESIIGTWEGKHPEPHLIITIWY